MLLFAGGMLARMPLFNGGRGIGPDHPLAVRQAVLASLLIGLLVVPLLGSSAPLRWHGMREPLRGFFTARAESELATEARLIAIPDGERASAWSRAPRSRTWRGLRGWR